MTAVGGRWSAPGRVNLIGEHIDYHGGCVLPIAIAARTTVTLEPRYDGRVIAISRQQEGTVEFDLNRLDRCAGWARYVAGVCWSFAQAGHKIGGFNLEVDSNVPVGAGLSSSAALEAAVALALNDLFDLGLSHESLVEIAHRAETDFVGVPCGRMDQAAALLTRSGSALLLDTATGQSRHIPFALANDINLLVIDTRVRHSLGDGRYAERRQLGERARDILSLPRLTSILPRELDKALRRLPPDLRPIVRHVVTEQARTIKAVNVLERDDPCSLGALLSESHASLRDDYQVSCLEADLAVETAVRCGALGARMTGAGFGGSVIALVGADRLRELRRMLDANFGGAGFAPPTTWVAEASGGARKDR
jgi:galactokinase